MLRVAVIGCRPIGIAHASGVSGSDRAKLVAGCDLSEAELESFDQKYREEWSGLSLYTDHQEMLEKEKPDIVTVATGDSSHAGLVVDAANAGVKGIYCEKPLATSLQDADRMVEAVERNGTILSVGHTRRWRPIWRHVKEEIVDKGEIGPVQYIIGALNGARSMMFRNGTHLVDTICYFADSDPKWVSAALEDGFDDFVSYKGDGGHEPASEPSVSGYIRFRNGVRGIFAGGTKQSAGSKFRIQVVGTTGQVDFEGERADLVVDDQRTPIQEPDWPVTGIPLGIQELIKLVDEGGDPISPARAGHRVVEILIGFLESHRRGNVRVDLPIPRGELSTG
jgi:predicted dehydrogenase